MEAIVIPPLPTRYMRAIGSVALLSLAHATSISGAGPIAVGDEAPDFTLRATDGSVHSLSDYRGRLVYFFFFASW